MRDQPSFTVDNRKVADAESSELSHTTEIDTTLHAIGDDEHSQLAFSAGAPRDQIPS